ncbi:MAG: hypothetical protein ACJ8E0_11560 [Sphingomicrobium sp.]
MKVRLGKILAEEERDGPIDWKIVDRLSNDLLSELQMPVPLIVDEYLRGFDRRRQDIVFGHAQRVQLLLYLRSKSHPQI